MSTMFAYIIAILAHHDDHLLRIDATLEKHSQTLDKHTEILDEHTKKLDEHSKILNEHSEKLDEHSEKLDNLTIQVDGIARHVVVMDERLDRIEEKIDKLPSAETFEAHVEVTDKLLQHLVRLEEQDAMRLEAQRRMQDQIDANTNDIVLLKEHILH